MAPLRSLPVFLLAAGCGAAGWFGGRAAQEGLRPAPRTATASAPALTKTVREPVLAPGSPAAHWMKRANAAASGDFPALLAELETVFPSDESKESRYAAQQWLLALWITRDADAATEYVAEQNDKRLGVLFGTLVGRLAPAQAVELMNGPLREALGKGFPYAVMNALAGANPREFLKVDPQSAGDVFFDYYPDALRTLAATDPVAAADDWTRRGATVPGGEEALHEVLHSIVWTWGADDPQAARRWVEALTHPEARRLARHAWLGSLARKDVAAARRELANMDLGVWLPWPSDGQESPEMKDYGDARLLVLVALARVDFAAAMGELESVSRISGGTFSEYLRETVATSAAEALPDDPAAFLAAFAKLTGPNSEPLDAALSAEIRKHMVAAKMTGWSARESLEVVRLMESGKTAESLEISQVNSLLAEQVLEQAMQRDTEGSLAFIAALPDAERGRMAQVAFDCLDNQNVPDLLSAAAMIPPELWGEGMANLLARWPEESAPVLRDLADSPQTGPARAAFTKLWADQNPEAAAQWVAALPQGAAPAARGLTEAWAAYDDTAASAWTDSLPPGAARDGAALGLASAVAAAEPEAAWHWAASISNAALSADAFRNVARRWGREAPPEFRTAFAAALDRTGLPAEEKAAALRSLDQPRSP